MASSLEPNDEEHIISDIGIYNKYIGQPVFCIPNTFAILFKTHCPPESIENRILIDGNTNRLDTCMFLSLHLIHFCLCPYPSSLFTLLNNTQAKKVGQDFEVLSVESYHTLKSVYPHDVDVAGEVIEENNERRIYSYIQVISIFQLQSPSHKPKGRYYISLSESRDDLPSFFRKLGRFFKLTPQSHIVLYTETSGHYTPHSFSSVEDIIHISDQSGNILYISLVSGSDLPSEAYSLASLPQLNLDYSSDPPFESNNIVNYEEQERHQSAIQSTIEDNNAQYSAAFPYTSSPSDPTADFADYQDPSIRRPAVSTHTPSAPPQWSASYSAGSARGYDTLQPWSPGRPGIVGF